MPVVYILRSVSKKSFYIGSSRFDDGEKRLRNHNSGKVRSTKSKKPWYIIHIEDYDTYTEARKRELFLKTGVGRNWIYEKFRD